MFIKLEATIINSDFIEAFDENHLVLSRGRLHSLSETDYNTLCRLLLPKERTASESKSDLAPLFERLHALTGGKGKPIFNLQREKKLKFLLDTKKGKMTEEQLIKAATNIGQDSFLQGENESKKRYGDIDYLLRPDKAAKWAEDQIQKKKGMF